MKKIAHKSFFLLIPTRDRLEHLKNLLLDFSPFAPYISNCVIVDQSENFIGKDFEYVNYNFPITILKGDRNKGVNHSRNLALKHYNNEDWIFCLDDDLRVAKEELDKIPQALIDLNVDVLVFGCNEDRKNLKQKKYTELIDSISKPNILGKSRMRLQVSSGLCLIHHSKFKDAGNYFDEKFSFWGDDWDLGFRLLNAGSLILFYPEINFTHLEVSSGGQRSYKAKINIERNKVHLKYYFYKKHFSERALLERYILDQMYDLKKLKLIEMYHNYKSYKRIK